MREKMNSLHDDVLTKLHEIFEDLLTTTCVYAHAAFRCCLGAFEICGVISGRILSIKEYSDAGRTFESYRSIGGCADHTVCAANNTNNMMSEAADMLKDIGLNMKGLCLDCTRKKIAGDESIVCRLGHTTLPADAAASSTPSN